MTPGMEFSASPTTADYLERLAEFVVGLVFPAEMFYHRYRHEAGPKDHTVQQQG